MQLSTTDWIIAVFAAWLILTTFASLVYFGLARLTSGVVRRPAGAAGLAGIERPTRIRSAANGLLLLAAALLIFSLVAIFLTAGA